MAAVPDPRNFKPANTRRSTVKQRRQQHVLDVAVRAGHATRQRTRRFFRFAARTLLALAVGAGLWFGGQRAVAWLLLKNPEYNVAELTVETDGSLQPDAVLAAADLHKGGNIFLVNLSRAKARLEALPQVEKVQVSRRLPNRIAVQINERQPVAWVAPARGAATREEVTGSREAYLVDTRGVLLPPVGGSNQTAFLPIIRSYTAGPRAAGQEAEGEEIKAALDLLHAQQDAMVSERFQIQEIDLSRGFGLQVTDRNGLKVLFGLDDMDRQLKRLDVALQAFERRSEKVQTINLLAQKNVPVTFVTEPAPDPPADPPAPETPAATPAKTPASAKGKENDGGKEKGRGKEKTKAKAKEPPKSKEHAAPKPKSSPAKPRAGRAIQPFESGH